MFFIILITLCFIMDYIYPQNYHVQSAWIPLAVAGISAVGSIWSAHKSASAAKKAGQEQAKIARKQLKYAKEFEQRQRADRERAFEMAKTAAAPSAQELANLDKMMEANDKRYQDALSQIDKYDDLLDQVDPIMKESGEQTLQLMRGEQAKILQPALKIRQQQRDSYMNQLAARLGPGFRTTSAGIMAMNKFDSDTEMQIAELQNQAVMNVSSINQQYIGASEGLRRNVASMSDQANQARQLGIGATQDILGNFKAREQQAINAFTGMPVSNEGTINAYSNLTGVIGNKYVGDIAFNNTMSNLFGKVAGIGLGMTADQYAQTGNLKMGDRFAYNSASILGPGFYSTPINIGNPNLSSVYGGGGGGGGGGGYQSQSSLSIGDPSLSSTMGSGRSTGVGGYWANAERTIPYNGTIAPGYGRGFFT